MMGTKGGDQDRLFYSFNLDKHVPADHPLRGIDHFLDLSELRRHLEPFYSHRSSVSRSGADDPDADGGLYDRAVEISFSTWRNSGRRQDTVT
jgi:hypothetical protein